MKRVGLTILLLLSPFAIGQTTNYTMTQVAQHATASDCWMVLNTNKVYNFTAFVSRHPGGSGFTSYCGRDGTAAFNAIGHSSSAVSQEATYLIGNLVATPPPISVTLVPTIASVQVGKTQQFTATVANSTSGVTWKTTSGTISSTGLFTAGSTAGTATVTATSVQDTTKLATATVTITAVPVPISVTIAPTTANITAGQTQQFTAAVTSSTQGVTWKTTVGTISSTGLLTTTVAGSGVVTATSVQDTTKSASAQVTVVPVPPPAVTVTIIPSSLTLNAGASTTLTAQVVNSTQGVTWTSTPNLGTLNANGLSATYTAGTATGTVTVTATSVQDTTKKAISSITIIPVTPPPPPPVVTLNPIEVAKHNTAADCWMIIGTNVYNVTAFIPQHPESGKPMIPLCGQDATGPFTAVGHSNRAVTLLPSFLLGALVPNPPPPPPPPTTQLCTITQSTNAFTVTCKATTPAIPVKTYRCSPTVTTTGLTIACTVRSVDN